MKRHVTLLTTLLVGILAWATVLSPEGALQRAQQQCPRKMRAAVESKGDVTLAYTLCDSTTAEPSVYAFNKPQGGWMLMPADAIAAPVLAFSDNGTIEADKLSPEFLYWMQFYQDEIQQAREREKMRTAPRRTPKEWPAGFGRPDRATIEPLCSTRWNQDSPYNRQCPTVGTARCATGCVATAMAQL